MASLTALRWAIRAWKVDISDQTIQACFKKVLNGQNNPTMVGYLLLEDVQTGINRRSISNVNEIMKTAQFLNSVQE